MKAIRLHPILICVLFFASVAAAQDLGIYRLPPEARDALVEMKAAVRHGRIDGDIIAELTPQQADHLRQCGFQPEQLYASIAQEDEVFRHLPGFDEFHTYEEIRDDFYALAAAYPDITLFEHLGYSVQNRELFALKITDNPQIEEDEPEVVFWGCIHGNEYTSAEIPYLYAIYLCQNYGIDPQVTQYVENNEIWCIPMINPDGRANGSRYNANGIDLNREFGYNWDGWGSSPFPFSQVESRAVREFCLDNNVSLSIVYHCSGDEFYHPWGYFPHDAPDYGVLTRVGERYANAASYAFMSSFASYQTHGEVLDWAYGCFGGLSYTAEVSSSSSAVPYTFERNQTGMNIFCELAGEGLHGNVTDAQTGEPVWAAVWICGNPIPAYTDPELGDLHRLVLPGTYDLTVWANGYLPQTVSGVVVYYGSPGQFQVALEPGGGEYAFMVTSVNQDDPNNAYNNITYPAWALGAPDGIPCSIGSGGFIVLDMGPGHEITDGPDDDFTVTEVIHPRDPNPEQYRVYAGDAYVQNIPIGTAVGTASFDLATAGVISTRYLKIVDESGSSPNLPLAGLDLDAITALNSERMAGTGILARTAWPADINLSASPNPFNPVTMIRFELRDASFVGLGVYDISGRKVAELVSGWREAGLHKMIFDASNLASGIYFCRFQADQGSDIIKMVLFK